MKQLLIPPVFLLSLLIGFTAYGADFKVSVTPAQLAMLLEGIDWPLPRFSGWRKISYHRLHPD
jgi:hypothetical protein